MGMLGVPELALIGGIIILLFGAKKIPEVASGIGKGIKEFRNATDETTKEITSTDIPKEK
jgi:sec-independent protein translocase protein TatA